MNHRARSRRTTSWAMAGLLLAAVALAGPLAAGTPAAAATVTLVGGASSDWRWFDAAIGPVRIYRDFDKGFSFATWPQTNAYRAHPTAAANDYSFKILPQRLVDPGDPINAQLKAFIATTPKNIILTNHHEPDYDYVYLQTYTPAQYRAGMVALAGLVRAQNAVDGGTRRTSVILMNASFKGTWAYPASDSWPTDSRDGGHVDLISADVYALPHATGTPGVPPGYTDGVNWQKPAYLMGFLKSFADANHTTWAVSEIGYLEDVHDPARKAATLRDAVAYARANGADHISYFDTSGPRADWRLRYATPVGSVSATSRAATAWKALTTAP